MFLKASGAATFIFIQENLLSYVFSLLNEKGGRQFGQLALAPQRLWCWLGKAAHQGQAFKSWPAPALLHWWTEIVLRRPLEQWPGNACCPCAGERRRMCFLSVGILTEAQASSDCTCPSSSPHAGLQQQQRLSYQHGEYQTLEGYNFLLGLYMLCEVDKLWQLLH